MLLIIRRWWVDLAEVIRYLGDFVRSYSLQEIFEELVKLQLPSLQYWFENLFDQILRSSVIWLLCIFYRVANFNHKKSTIANLILINNICNESFSVVSEDTSNVFHSSCEHIRLGQFKILIRVPSFTLRISFISPQIFKDFINSTPMFLLFLSVSSLSSDHFWSIVMNIPNQGKD